MSKFYGNYINEWYGNVKAVAAEKLNQTDRRWLMMTDIAMLGYFVRALVRIHLFSIMKWIFLSVRCDNLTHYFKSRIDFVHHQHHQLQS